MTRLLLKLVPDSGRNNLTFFFGKLNVILTLDEKQPLDASAGMPDGLSESCSFSFYNDQLWELLHAETGDKEVKRKDNKFNISFPQSILWIPGHYFFLFRSGETILRFDLQLDEQGVMSETSVRQCPKLSEEDMLSGALPSHKVWTRFFSVTPGVMQFKRWLIERLQERALNSLRAEHHHGVLTHCNNLLLASPTPDFVGRNVLLLKNIAEIKCESESADCTTLYDPSRTNPYYNLDELFSKQVSDDNALNLELPVLKDRIYTFRNIWALMDPGREYVLKKILSHCPSTYDSVIFCGTQEDLDRLLELKPSLQGYFPQRNRLAIEPCTLDEILRIFFREADSACLTFTPEATDAVCRLLTDRFHQGTITHWLWMDIRHYIQQHLLPAYTRRAIAAIQHGSSPTEVLDVLPEDLEDVTS